jgi:hypothetical protein
MPGARALATAFPAGYLVHLVEEAFAGSGFPAWLSGTLGADLSIREFAAINTVGAVAHPVISIVAFSI